MQSLYPILNPAQQAAMRTHWPALSAGWEHYQELVGLGLARTLLVFTVGFALLGCACLVLAIRGLATHDLVGHWAVLAQLLPWAVGVFLVLIGLLVLGAWLASRRIIWRLTMPVFESFNQALPFTSLPVLELFALNSRGPEPILLSALAWSAHWEQPPLAYPAEAMLDALFDFAQAFAPPAR